MRTVLILLTRHGPSVLAGGVLLGLAWPGLAVLARPLMPATVFIFVLGTLLRVDTAELRAALARPRISVPLLAGMAGDGVPVAIGPLDLAWRLALLVGSAEGVALLLRRRAARTLAAHGLALDGLIVMALLVFALATMSGIRAMIEAAPGRALAFVLLAYGCNIGLQLLAAAVFPGDASARSAIGLIAGKRNVSLIPSRARPRPGSTCLADPPWPRPATRPRPACPPLPVAGPRSQRNRLGAICAWR